MQGDELVARIRQLIPDLPIIMATAFVQEYKTFGEASGYADALLLKPFSFDELRGAIEQVLDKGYTQDESVMPLEIEAPPAQNFIPPPEP